MTDGVHTDVIVVPDPYVGRIVQDAAQALEAQGASVTFMPPDEFQRGGTSAHRSAELALVGVAFKFTREVMAEMPRLRAIVSAVIGTDTIDVQAASDQGIWVGYGSNEETAESTAEATILLMLALLYDLRGNERVVHENLPRPVEPPSRMLKSRVVGLVGFGKIARAVAQRLHPWGVEILAYRRRSVPLDDWHYVKFVSLEELLARSDIVSVHASLNAESRGLLDRSRLSRMKRGSYLINTARGGIVDEAALHELVCAGQVRGIALDAFEVEPLPPQNPLRGLSNAILTPHMLGHTLESYAALSRAAARNVMDVLEGKAPRCCANHDLVIGHARPFVPISKSRRYS